MHFRPARPLAGLVVLWFVAGVAFGAFPPPCGRLRRIVGYPQPATATLWGAEIPYYKVSSLNKEFRPEDLVPDHEDGDLYIGFTGGHTYFVFNGKRFDGGKALHSAGRVSDRPVLEEGVILRVRNAPEDIAIGLNSQLVTSRRSFNFTCSQGVCSVLTKAGLKVEGYTNFVPSRLLRSILIQGIATSRGERLKVDCLLVNREGLERHLTNSHIVEGVRILLMMIPPAALGLKPMK